MEGKRSTAAPVPKNKRKVLASAPDFQLAPPPLAATLASPIANPQPIMDQFLTLQQEYLADFLTLYGSADPSQVDFKKDIRVPALKFYEKYKDLLACRDFQVPGVFLNPANEAPFGTLMYCMAYLIYQRAKMNIQTFGQKR